MKLALVFPGQGSQYVGMGKTDYDSNQLVRDMYDKGEEILGMPIKRISFDGPEELLNRTDYTQPALFINSVALFELVRDRLDFFAIAGHSLGEYTALHIAGVLSFDEALLAVKKRGELMAHVKGGGMLAVIGGDHKIVEEVVEEFSEGGTITIANYNSPKQLVLSGEVNLLKLAEAKLKDKNIKRLIWLPVSGAFHSSMMEKPKRELEHFLNHIEFKKPQYKFYSNVTGSDESNPKRIKDLLILQLTSSVLWQRIVEGLRQDGVDTFLEIGPKRVLSGLIKRIYPEAKLFNIEKLDDIESLPREIFKNEAQG